MAEGFFLQVARDAARVNDKTVDLDEPRERISGELTGKRPARVELADLQKVEDCSGAGRTGLGAQLEVPAQRIGAHVGLLGFVEEEVDAPDRVGYAAGPGACRTGYQRRWPLAAQGGNETPAKVAVFAGQMLGAKGIGQRCNLAIPVLHGDRHTLAVKG
ncbi:hypothetical protein C6Q09_08970 [Burkholderia multivorans]|nr:hypothetical protein C6Q09_08970 [Burkholderia multivorans]